MGLTGRKFNNELKLATVGRLEQGISIAEAARALEVDRTSCRAGGGSSDKSGELFGKIQMLKGEIDRTPVCQLALQTRQRGVLSRPQRVLARSG